MSNASPNRCGSSYNGEIFNHAALRPELQQDSARVQDEKRYRNHPPRLPAVGPASRRTLSRRCSAFALWDKDARVLFCARDRLGIKPFYYFWDGRLFASRRKSRLCWSIRAFRFVWEAALPEYLASGYLTGDQTLFTNVRKLMPGHRLSLDLKHSRAPRAADRAILGRSRSHSVPRPVRDDDWIRECRNAWKKPWRRA